MHATAWIILILASIIVRSAWQDKPAGPLLARWRQRWNLWAYGDARQRTGFRTRLLDANAYFWLAGRNRLKPAYTLAALGLLFAGWLALRMKYPAAMSDAPVYITLAIIGHSIIKFWVASESCRCLFFDRRAGTLELILSTPIRVEEILRGQWLALQRQFGWPVLLMLGADVLMFIAGNRSLAGGENGTEWLLTFLFGTVMFVADLYAIGWVSMWLGMVSRRLNRASGGAIVRIMVLPWFVYAACITAIVLTNLEGFTPSATFFLGLWFAIGTVNDAFFLLMARTNLLQRFRALATERFAAKPPGWFGMRKHPGEARAPQVRVAES